MGGRSRRAGADNQKKLAAACWMPCKGARLQYTLLHTPTLISHESMGLILLPRCCCGAASQWWSSCQSNSRRKAERPKTAVGHKVLVFRQPHEPKKDTTLSAILSTALYYHYYTKRAYIYGHTGTHFERTRTPYRTRKQQGRNAPTTSSHLVLHPISLSRHSGRHAHRPLVADNLELDGDDGTVHLVLPSLRGRPTDPRWVRHFFAAGTGHRTSRAIGVAPLILR